MYDSQSVIKEIVLFSVTIVTSMHTLIPVDAQDTLSDVDTRSLVNSDRRWDQIAGLVLQENIGVNPQ